MKTGVANLPLHGGKCPPWLFKRMKPLAGLISEWIVNEYGTKEFLSRLSDPFFFQAFGNVLGFDWHSSGLTTTVCGALKEALNEANLGIQVCGGKGKVSRKTPSEIEQTQFNLSDGKIEELKRASRLAAKVDNSLIQDGFQLYHHIFVFDEKGRWAVIQQGMNENWARRYHWLGENLNSFVLEPHSAICSDLKKEKVLDMTAKESKEAQKISVDLVKEGSKKVEKYLKELKMPARHEIFPIDLSKRGLKMIEIAKEMNPKNYEELIGIRGIGPKTIRALALISDLIYGAEISWRDPVKYSFAHGGKDGIPYPVNRRVYDESIEILRNALEQSKLGNKELKMAIKRLNFFIDNS